jgi:hypothetical protein
MACQCQNTNPACANRDWLQSVFDDCFVGSGGGLGSLSIPVSGTIPAGSLIRVGWNYRTWTGTYEDDPATLKNGIIAGLLATGDFYQAQVDLTEGWLKNYMTLTLTTNKDLAANTVGSYIQGRIQQIFPTIELYPPDPVLLDALPSDYNPDTSHLQPGDCFDALYNKVSCNSPTVAGVISASGEPTVTPDNQQQTSSKCPPGYYDAGWVWTDCKPLSQQRQQPPQCDWNTMSLTNYAACLLGVTPSNAALIGAFGALLGVILIAKIAK